MKILRGDHHGGESGPKGSGCPFQGEGGVFEFALNPPRRACCKSLPLHSSR